VSPWNRLLHRLGFHSLDRCGELHNWERVDGHWVAGILIPPVERSPGLPTEAMEPPRKLPKVPLTAVPPPPTTLIRAQRPPGRHRPEDERIQPPRRGD